MFTCRKCGAIINMSSSAGQLPTPQMTVYAATKVQFLLHVCVSLSSIIQDTILETRRYLHLKRGKK